MQVINKKLKHQKNEIIDSITYAKRLKDTILPSSLKMKDVLNDYFLIYKPKDIVAGDFYWVEKIKNFRLFAVADCTGHGVPGSMMSILCKNAIDNVIRDTTNFGYIFSAYFYSLPLLCMGYELEAYELVFLVKKVTQMSTVIMSLDLAGANCAHAMEYYLKLDFQDNFKKIYNPSKGLKPIEFTL